MDMAVIGMEQIGMSQAPPSCPNGFLYQIRSGDTLFAIAQRFGTTIGAIQAANPGLDPNSLRVAQLICIPRAAAPGRCPAGSSPYVIRSGDTFYAIAQRSGITVGQLEAANPGINPNALRVGQAICVPGRAPGVPRGSCPAGSTPYVIRSGDTLHAIAQRAGVTVNQIVAVNPGINPNALRIGQTICVPGRAPSGGGFPACPAGSAPYVIRSGDTFYGVAQRFGLTVAALTAANPGVRPNALQIGQLICIPGRAATARALACSTNLNATSSAPDASGRIWLDTNAAGNLEITVSGVGLPPPSTLGGTAYGANVVVDGTQVWVPMVQTVEGRWTGTVVRAPIPNIVARGRVGVYPGPVLTGALTDCR